MHKGKAGLAGSGLRGDREGRRSSRDIDHRFFPRIIPHGGVDGARGSRSGGGDVSGGTCAVLGENKYQ
jgi:hypothetical protein